ncbi:unnamed protein product [Mytilus edulis]|uniref:YqaJ viral recombinase domain-containing protein n=1 Tax=Mytilus edulis TaxID=6550 RepID=A0A8S3S3P5_MYTED|nr:unnamed protein product [Mytilus edulis]
MAINFKNYSVQELRSYLQSRLIAATKFNKRKLIELAEYAHDLKLEIIEEDDYTDLYVSEVKDWTVDLRGVPSVETGDIMIYLPSTCQWSDDRLRDYKQDNGYKFQRDDGSCKQVVALLFALSSFVSRHTDRHTLVGTDTICAWDKPKQETRPSKIAELEYLSKKSDIKHTFNPVKQRETHASKRDLQLKVYDLCKGSSAGFLQIVDPPSDESESDEETAEYFSDILRGFSESDDILECLHNKHDNAYIYNVEQDATEFGIKMEKVAKTQYFDRFKTHHKKSSFKDCGLFVSKASPFLGASPDGVVKCKCCGTRLVEIKCTFKYADKTPMEVANLQTYHVQNINGEIKLKRLHHGTTRFRHN